MLNALAAASDVVGGIDRIGRIVKVVVYVASAPDFTGQPLVANGASELLGDVFGDAGVHVRSAVGVPVLVFGGRVDLEPELLPGEVVDIVTVTPADQPLAEALVAGPENLQAAATRALAGWVARA